ncbi:YchF/TatD family DNA exonuclease [Paenibacillus sp. KQZ6P-2]|uniref:YchF/TatD family DNA exonuclease n=1 Tax=Paenibacillus mangrovi TaxID=2931978 RepID=A0A9X1WRJ5_9BACL|nr:TatD family hydrolase [Paenibacillus mangrovi]MCJ8014047.1 YchF/TatD family DNA exonuclease [Paenibacillus mangrovi]
MLSQIIDIGVNLTNRSFDKDREEVLIRAEAAGVSPLIITGTSVESSRKAAKYAELYSGKLYATAGVHPHDVKECGGDTLDRLRELAALPQVVAIGECGLDYNRDFSPRDVQRHWFHEQIRLAEELGMPLFLHEREAFADFASMMQDHPGMIARSVVHCFTGTGEELHAYLDMGFHIGITGWICDERRGQHLRELVKDIPLNRLMIETDAPYLTPRDLRPKPQNGRNEPAFLAHIVKVIASCMGRDVEEVASQTSRTTKAFFNMD